MSGGGFGLLADSAETFIQARRKLVSGLAAPFQARCAGRQASLRRSPAFRIAAREAPVPGKERAGPAVLRLQPFFLRDLRACFSLMPDTPTSITSTHYRQIQPS